MSAPAPLAPRTLPLLWPQITRRPLTGAAELAVAEAVSGSGPRPGKVTTVILELVETIAGRACDVDLVRGLASGCREWLLQQLGAGCRAGMDGSGQDWFDVTCPHCGTRSDLALDLADMPRAGVSPAPVAVMTDAGALAFDCPNGHHEETLAAALVSGITDGTDPRRSFLAAAALFADAPAVLARLPAGDLDAIEAALDAAAPEVADEITTTCPACDADFTLRLDPLDFAFPSGQGLIAEIHSLSFAYKWREADILAMPMRRRRQYAALVAQTGAVRAGAWGAAP